MSAQSDSVGVRLSGTLGGFTLDVEFVVPMRGISAIVGPSGCGKTTLLRCLAGLRRFEGHVSVGDEMWQDDGRDVFLKPHQRSLGYVFQEASLFPHMSVRENLLYGLRRRRQARDIDGPGFERAIDLLGIRGLLNRPPNVLSGGERQRVAVGRALLSRPKILLMDEPLAGLDQQAKGEILPYLEALHSTLEVPIVYVSHDMREVARLADTLVVMANGRIAYCGRMDAGLERLDLEFAGDPHEAGVVLRSRVSGHDKRLRMTRLDHHGQEIVIPAADLGVGDEVRLRIRADDVALATARPKEISVRNILAGSVERVVEAAGTAFADVLVDIGGARLRARVTRDAVEDLRLAQGQEVYALVKSITFERPAPAVESSVDSADPSGARA